MPDFGGKASAQVSLSLEHCGLPRVPPKVATAPKLRQLSISRNPLLDFTALAGLRHLGDLRLASCGMTQLPRLLGDLPFSEAFAALRAERKARSMARSLSPEKAERLAAGPIVGYKGLVISENPFKDKALRAAANISDTEERTFAVQDWCREKGIWSGQDRRRLV